MMYIYVYHFASLSEFSTAAMLQDMGTPLYTLRIPPNGCETGLNGVFIVVVFDDDDVVVVVAVVVVAADGVVDDDDDDDCCLCCCRC